MTGKYAWLLLISLSISLAGCYPKEQQKNDGNVTLIVKSIGNTTTERFSVTKANALQLLRHKHDVDVIKNSFIKCIDDVCAEKEYLWAFYVNGNFILSSADKYYPQDKDIIEFRFGKLGGG